MMRVYKSIIIIVLFVNSGLCEPEVKLPQGRAIGVYMESKLGRKFEAFLGLPFAEAAIGELRFKVAQTPKPWSGTFNASFFGSECPQLSFFNQDIVGNDDCLFINVFKPKGIKKNLDVMVNIHGGGFSAGSANFLTPNNLMDSDIVFAAFNYRVSPMGFLSTGDDVMPGNIGLKDQVAALRWVKDNIQYFGGNPDNVMISGLSAGGASVHYHYLSPLSKGLFKRGISTSGVSLNPWSLSEKVPEKTRTLAASLGCPTKDSKALLECFNTRPTSQIIRHNSQLKKTILFPMAPIGPMIEEVGSKDAFITKHPYQILKDGEHNDLPLVFSFSENEGLMYSAFENQFIDNWDDMLPHALDFNYTVKLEKQPEVVKRINDFYLKGKSVKDSMKEIVELFGDRIFAVGIMQAGLMQAKVSKSPIYLYIFGYRGDVKFPFFNFTMEGVNHGEECLYTYTILSINVETEADKRVEQRFRHLHTSFASTGVPEYLEGVPLVEIDKMSLKLKYTSIKSSEQAEILDEDLANIKFWSSLPIEEHIHTAAEIFRNVKKEL